MALLLTLCCAWAQAQDRTNAYGYAFTAEELAQYPQKTNLPTVYLEVYKMNVDQTTGKATLALDEQGNPQMIDYTEVFGTKYDWYYTANIIIRDDNGTIEERNEQTTVRGRGNSTWNLGNGQYKKGLRLKFPSKVALLGSGFANSKSWTLLANNYDPTLIRNAMTYELGKKIGMPFCPAYKFIDLVVCGHYMGTYQISDQVQVAKDRVNIDEATGYFMEILKNKTGFLEDPYIRVEMGNNWTLMDVNIKSPDPDVATESGPTADPKYNDLKAHLNKVAGLAYTGGFDRPNSWRKFVDVDAAVRAMIGLDITGNYDGVVGNDYAYMNDLDSKIVFGPLWDLDLAWGGLVNGTNMTEKHFWQGEDAPFGSICQRVFENDPYFVKALWERWQQIYNNGSIINYLQGKVDDLASMVAQSAALNYSSEEGGAGHLLNKGSWNDGNNYANLAATYAVMKKFIQEHIEWLNTNYKAKYDALGCDNLPEIPESGLFFDGTGVLWNGGENVYTFVATADQVRVGAELTIQVEGAGANFFTFTTNQNSKWFQTNGGESLTYNRTLTPEDVALLRANDNTFRLVVSSGTCSSVTLVAPECTTHDYTNCSYAEQDDGTYRRMCSVCSAVETEGETYYQFTVYPESATANAKIYATTWTPDAEHPNSVASIAVDLGKEPAGYNIINTTKNTAGDKTCADFRLVDGHPFFSDDKFVAAKATYSRTVTNKWGTMVLPFKQQQAVTETAKYYHLSALNGTGDEQTLVLTPIQPDIEDNASAFVPVFFCRANDGVATVTVNATDVTVKKSNSKTAMTGVTVAGMTLKGVMEKTVFNVGTGQADEGRNLYYISKDEFWHATGKLTMNPFRAYLEADTPSQAARFSIFAEDTAQPTAISQPTLSSVIACVEDGGVRLSGADGAQVRISTISGTLLLDSQLKAGQTLFVPLTSGVYVVNGNKVIIK